MQHEPTQPSLGTDRATRSRRQDAVRRAHDLVALGKGSTITARDAAFAELPGVARGCTAEELGAPAGPAPTLDETVVEKIAEQLRALDAQRARLEALLGQAGK
ncbi:MAG: hypothetical protein AAF790_08410 [Planctomycetota bacterium]